MIRWGESILFAESIIVSNHSFPQFFVEVLIERQSMVNMASIAIYQPAVILLSFISL